MVRVKVCGITNMHNAVYAVQSGVSALGFIFYKKSPRYISPSKAKKIIENLPPFVIPVGVFVNATDRQINEVCRFTRIHTVQLHGDEPADLCHRLSHYKLIKAFRIHDKFKLKTIKPYKVDAYLFDAYQEDAFGGTGKTFSWHLLKALISPNRSYISGGLNADNVRECIAITKPYAVDISSGVEHKPGIKNHKAIDEFMTVMTHTQATGGESEPPLQDASALNLDTDDTTSPDASGSTN
jgi:phosphoribosylanthranilate isomerase